ncbi:2400_t:CDS:2 [Cetraspora pellucida]|uniref:2400_t:CDS:1 n=1 Tax=Cetraspora pellucida TaxID=1433469 RepID=A0A9N9GFZ2_9GLOM|nr:2400_t:CDS:2 [Cetraspora pellucida]
MVIEKSDKEKLVIENIKEQASEMQSNLSKFEEVVDYEQLKQYLQEKYINSNLDKKQKKIVS